MTEPTLPARKRIALAVVSFFRVLTNRQYAVKVMQLEVAPELPSLPAPEPAIPLRMARDLRPALQLLGALQREGRLVDFVQQDILQFSDADVGAAARVVHDGCRRALLHVARFVPVREDAEGHEVTVPAGFDAAALLLTGNVSGAPPFHGTLRHRGWRAQDFTLPDIMGETDCTVIAPAEVEL